jgi:hypothetical protein
MKAAGFVIELVDREGGLGDGESVSSRPVAAD